MHKLNLRHILSGPLLPYSGEKPDLSGVMTKVIAKNFFLFPVILFMPELTLSYNWPETAEQCKDC